MKVIIAEKRSLAKTIAYSLHAKLTPISDYNENDIIVCNAHGHLLELFDLDDYFGTKIPWGEKLPFFPEQFKYRLKKDEGDKKLYHEIVALINDDKCDEIICCGDADREGEVIVRLILRYGLKDKTKKITRLWLPSQTEEVIKEQMKLRKEVSFYDNLYNEGISRQYMDWLIGINLTRAVSSKAKTTLKIGRVLCPIVIAIYEREKAINEFVTSYYYSLESDIDGLKLTSKLKFEENELANAQSVCDKYNSQMGVVTNVEFKTIKKQSPKLFSLSKLQGYCGKKLKLSPNDTLKIVQSLYEKGLVTYPRTNTEYLAESEKEKVSKLLSVHCPNKTVLKDSKTIFDDTKIESHSALTPTEKKLPLKDLTTNEQKIYEIIMRRFLAVFWKEECLLNQTEATVKVGTDDTHEYITVKGTSIMNLGWMEILEQDTNYKTIPQLQSNQLIAVQFKAIKKETQPPKYYTVETLGNYLTNPFRKKEAKNDDEEYKQLFLGCEIGTEATRGGIIEKAIQTEYITLKNNVYRIAPKGVFLVETLQKLGIDMGANQTVELQKTLKKVYRNELSTSQSLAYTKKQIAEYVKNIAERDIGVFKKENHQVIVGMCPWCGKELYELKGKYGFYYSHSQEVKKECSFSFNTPISIYGQTVSLSTSKIKQVLSNKAPKIKLKNKQGKEYEVALFVDKKPYISNGKKRVQFYTEFVNTKKTKK